MLCIYFAILSNCMYCCSVVHDALGISKNSRFSCKSLLDNKMVNLSFPRIFFLLLSKWLTQQKIFAPFDFSLHFITIRDKMSTILKVGCIKSIKSIMVHRNRLIGRTLHNIIWFFISLNTLISADNRWFEFSYLCINVLSQSNYYNNSLSWPCSKAYVNTKSSNYIQGTWYLYHRKIRSINHL